MSPKPVARIKILEILSTGQRKTTNELAKMIGSAPSTAWAALDKLHKEKLIYISSWKRSIGTRGRMGPRWALGNKRDKDQPKSDRNADSRRYYKNLDPLLKKLRGMRYHRRLNVWSGLK